MVTGGGGFIGSNLAESLSKNNTVTVIDDFSTGRKRSIEKLHAEIVEGSITDKELLLNICRDIDYIFHFAALPSVPRSIKEPELVHDVNATGTLDVLTAAKEANVKKVISISLTLSPSELYYNSVLLLLSFTSVF